MRGGGVQVSRTKYELFVSPDGFYVQTHCDCGSTLSSGEYLSSLHRALEQCQDGMIEHQRMHIRQNVAASKVVQP